jgi:hypothetical protein
MEVNLLTNFYLYGVCVLIFAEPHTNQIEGYIREKKQNYSDLVPLCGPCVIALINRTPLFGWYMVRCVVNNEHPKDTCDNEIVGLCMCSKYNTHSRLNSAA